MTGNFGSLRAEEPEQISEVLELVCKSPPHDSSRYPIDLRTALILTERMNPTIGIAREAINENLALQEQARALLLPSLATGMQLHVHRGALQPDEGWITPVDSQSLYFGGGSHTVAAETVHIPAIRIYSSLGDAFLEPLVARQRVNQFQYVARATTNQVLLTVSDQFLELMGATASLNGARLIENEASKLVESMDAFVQAGQARKADANRTHVRALLVQNEIQRGEERIAIAAAQLSNTLSLDPAAQIQVAAISLDSIDLISLSHDLDSLLTIALRQRPEIMASSAAISAQEVKAREEQLRPWLPTITLGMSGGVYGGGSNLVPYSFGHFDGRSDFDVLAVWTVRNAGMGTQAIQNRIWAERDQAYSAQRQVINRVRREVAESFALSEERRKQIDYARTGLAQAESGYREELARIAGGEGLPIEALNSLDLFNRALQDFIAAVVQYDQAQFRLFVALGNPPQVALANLSVQ